MTLTVVVVVVVVVVVEWVFPCNPLDRLDPFVCMWRWWWWCWSLLTAASKLEKFCDIVWRSQRMIPPPQTSSSPVCEPQWEEADT